MSAAPQLAPVVVIAGPTAAGKTALAIRLALRFRGEIVNADSMQVYRGMDIGTAKPSVRERAAVPHHLIDIVAPDESYHAARFSGDAAAAIGSIRERGHLPFLVGGTGLYIRAALQGLNAGAGRDPSFRAALEAEHARARAQGDPGRLHRRLAELDPTSAARLHPNDLVRIVRALEIHATTGRSASQVYRERALSPRYDALYCVLDPGREELARRIDARCEAMIAGGLLQEVRALRDAGYGPELASMKAIGYRHMQPVIEGRETLANVLDAMKRDTRQFARRQRTWFRGEAGATWVDPADEAGIAARIEAFLAARAAA
jgi:tRNA dimethylallyltransferase